MRVQKRQHPRSGFTLVEILVVVAIVLLASMIALPTIVTNLNGRQVTDAARIFSGSLVGARDSAIRYNQPRGIRLLPDPTMTIPAPGQPGAGTIQLCYNRMIPIEPAGDYSQGKVTIGPHYFPGGNPPNFPPAYPLPRATAARYPYPDSSPVQQSLTTHVLMIEEAPFRDGYVLGTGQPNSPTNWYWNIRIGDKIKINGTGRAYTIVGPCTINPWATGANQGNPELFVNVGAPGVRSPLVRTYYDYDVTATPPLTMASQLNPEFLFVVNGEDDDLDGYVDEGWDGVNNNPIPAAPHTPLTTDNDDTDEFFEWEKEKWVGALTADALVDNPGGTPTESPTPTWALTNFQKGTQDVSYIIERRPVPSPGAREVVLPAGMVIDATAWNTTRERSRIPIQYGSLYCDVLVNPTGLYIPTTQYSTPTSADALPFLHFWITDRNDVHPRGSVWGISTTGAPNLNPSSTLAKLYYELPMSSDTPGYPPTANPTAPILKNDRRLVTMFAQNGLVVTNTIETIPAPNTTLPGEGFNIGNVNNPFLKAQQGLRETR
ncbi:prepilin-type N-terminal cleavage/methylation domain-containing protein [Singulisphaera sp. Ch08]|uniref:Prepilin-type N-terminal cleavage/methylation domain-containing protein n=1 Tax=Singulisphaera sp. Ch08 TaxID=3120278 RepID=A0AAU7CRZ3_9BACT